MPRNGAGSYSLPVGYLATPGEDILATQHNQPLEDIAGALTGSVPRDGSAGMTGNLAMGGNRITDLAEPVGANDAVRLADLTLVAGAVPAGAVMAFAMAAAPSGWLKANGAEVSRTTYAALFAAIGTTFGSGNGTTTFKLPELRGEFLRALDDGRGVDTGRALGSAQADDNKAHLHTGSTNTTGSHTHTGTTDSAGAHTHTVPVGSGGATNGPASTAFANTTQTTSSAGAHTHGMSLNDAGDHSHTLTIASSGGTEARPRNIALLYCIKT